MERILRAEPQESVLPDIRDGVCDDRFFHTPASTSHFQTLWYKITLIRARNRLRIPLEIISGATRVGSRPVQVQFGVEHRCNLRCIMCVSTATRKAGSPPLMDRRLAVTALSQFSKLGSLLPFLRTIELTGTGEILLSSDLPVILDILKRHGVSASFVTNGQLMDGAKARMIVESDVEELIISLDAACKETYEMIRTGARWERLLSGIETLNRVKRDQGSDTPRLTFAGNFMRLNIEELPGLIEFTVAHGGDSVRLTTTIFYDRDLQNQNLRKCMKLTRRMIARGEALANHHGIEFNNWMDVPEDRPANSDSGAPARPVPSRRNAKPYSRFLSFRRCLTDPGWLTIALSKTISRLRQRLMRRFHRDEMVTEKLDILKVCRNPWTGFVAWRDGSVRVCCMDSVLLGNLNEQSFSEIWNGPPAREFRRSFLQSRPPEGCRNCCLVQKGRRQGRLLPRVSEFENVRVPPSKLKPGDTPGLCYHLDSPREDESLSGMARVSGWFFSRHGLKAIRLLVDGKVAAMAELGSPRPDVAERLNTERASPSGFRISLHTSPFENGCHLTALRITDGLDRTADVCHRTIRIVNHGA